MGALGEIAAGDAPAADHDLRPLGTAALDVREHLVHVLLRYQRPHLCRRVHRVADSHRSHPPQGLDGGGNGEVGSTKVRRKDGVIDMLKACDQTVLEAGEAVILTTPTPGGFGKA